MAPYVLAFAGPNGSGKSTVKRGFEDIIVNYINADDIKNEKGCSDLEAAKLATQLREQALADKVSFTFETVLSTPRNIELLQRAKQFGYKVEVVFVLTADEKINIERVKNRVKNGGHDVPEQKIKSRYHKSIANLSKLFEFSDIVWVIDNSTDKARLIIYFKNGIFDCYPSNLWDDEKLKKLIEGTL